MITVITVNHLMCDLISLQALLELPFGRARAQSPFPAPQQSHPPSTPAPVGLPQATAAQVHASHPRLVPFTPAAAASKHADEQGMYCTYCARDLRLQFDTDDDRIDINSSSTNVILHDH